MKEVAILIPSYRPKSYLERCLLSIESQTLSKSRFTVYLALNGPRNPYEIYIKSLLSRMRFDCKYFYIIEPSVSIARNYLIDNSSEDYIVFMDDDDFISDNYIESLLKVSSKSVIGVGDVKLFTPENGVTGSNYIGKCFRRLGSIEKSKVRSRQYYSSLMSKLISRSVIASTRFDSSLRKGEDSLFMASISKNVSALRKADRDTIYYVYERNESVTRRPAEKRKELSRLNYLIKAYTKMLFTTGYSRLFVFTRILATTVHIMKLIKLRK